MFKERIQEIFEFTKSESPYRKANKGWISQDIFLDISPLADTIKQKEEAAKVTLLWSPINNLLSGIFLILILGSILVFSSLSFVKAKFEFSFFNNYSVTDIVKVDENKVSKDNQMNASEPFNSSIEKSLDKGYQDQSNKKINSLDDNQIIIEKEIRINKIDKQQSNEKDIGVNQDTKITKTKKSTSNFI